MATKKKPAFTAACRICGKILALSVRQAWDNSTRYQTVEHRDYRDQLRCPGTGLEIDARLVRAEADAGPTPSPFARPTALAEVPHA